MTAGRMSVIFGAVALFATLAAIATAFLISELLGANGEAGSTRTASDWLTYRNQTYGYEISYPPVWAVDFISQSHQRITNGPDTVENGRVWILVNPTSGWCLAGRFEREPVTVSGVSGEAVECHDQELCSPFPACRSVAGGLSWQFRDFMGDDDLVVTGDFGHYEDTVRRIVESFRFLD